MKERLTGAIILVALIVLLVPELLTGPIRSSPRAAATPAAEGAPLRSYTINLADDTHSRSSAPPSGPEPPAALEGAAVAASSPSETPAVAPVPQSAPPEPKPRAAPAATQAAPPVAAATPAPHGASLAPAGSAAPPSAAAPASEGWMVQLGSFASRANAERLARQVRAGGFQVSVAQGGTGRRLYRVRVGPVRDREAASELAGQLRTAGHSGSVVPR